jgi:membrane associated rhomboid family serine protease
MTPWVMRLVVANVVMFFLTAAVPGLARELALVPALVLARPWTPFTYMFVHAGAFHLMFNMMGLFFFGPQLEARLGGARFLRLYLVSGLAGALFSLATPHVAIVGWATSGCSSASRATGPTPRSCSWGSYRSRRG